MSTTVFRVEKNREFVVISNKFLRNKEMSLKAKGLLALCLSLPEDWNYSLNGLVAICKESLTSIRSALKELEEFGHLKREKKKDEKGQFIYEYILFEHPHTDFLHMDNLHTENLCTENNLQQSTKKQSTENKELNNSLYIDNLDKIIDLSVSDKDLKSLYKQYIETRIDMNAPLTERGLKMLITRCERLTSGVVPLQKLLVENATINRWKNVYMPKAEEIEVENNLVIQEKRAFYGI